MTIPGAVSRWLYLESGVRFLGRRKAACAVAILTTALALGANSLVFSVTRAFLASSFGVPDAGRLYVIAPVRELAGRGDVVFAEAYTNYARLREGQQSFSDVTVIAQTNLSWSSEEEVRAVQGARVSASFFPVMGVQPLLGRAMSAEEEGPGAARVAVLSHGLWQSAFSGDRNVLGSSVLLDGTAHEIVGVMPPGFTHPLPSEIWLPFDLASPTAWTSVIGARTLTVYGRLRDGVTPQAAAAELDGWTERAIAADPGNREFRYTLQSIRQTLVPGADRTMALVQAGAILLVLLAVSNLASLFLAWGFERRQELSVRLALGASSGRIMRMLLVQSLVVVAAGGAAGLIVAILLIPALRAIDLTPALGIYFGELRVDGTVLLVSTVAVGAAGLLAGLLPAWLAGRGELAQSLRSGTRAVTLSPTATAWQKTMVLLQASLSVVIVAAAALIGVSFRNLNQVEPGYSAGDRVVARIRLSGEAYREHGQRAAFAKRLIEIASLEPDLASFAFTSALPVGDGTWGGRFYRNLAEADTDVEPLLAHFRRASADYTTTIGIPLLRGRVFSLHDDAESAPVAIISTSLADWLWPDEDPIGKRIYRALPAGPPAPLEVIGVVGDVMDAGLAAPAGQTVYVHWLQNSVAQLSIVATSRGTQESTLAAIRRVLRTTDPYLAAGGTETLATLARQANGLPRLQTMLLLTFAVVALMIVVLGSYGVMSQLVTSRERDFALRLLLGAEPAALGISILRQVALLSITGATLGAGGVWLLQSALEPMLFGIAPRSVAVLLAVCSFVLALAAAAAVPAAVRVMRTDPRAAVAPG